MTNPYRAMCAELVDSLENARRIIQRADGTLHINTAEFVLHRARALLAEAVAEGPTDEELLKAFLEATTANMRLQGGLSSSDANGIARQLDAQTVAGLRAVLARWGRPAAAPAPEVEAEGPSDEELLASVRHFYGDQTAADMGAEDDLRTARAVLARYGRPAAAPVPTSERPWERDGWCDAEGRCYGWDGDYWWMVSNPGAARETITHWLPANALPTPEATNE